MPRKKSLADIRQQSYRLQDALYRQSQVNEGRVERVVNAASRYSSNIRKAINAKNGTQGDYPLYGDDFTRKVSQRTYMGLANG